MNSGRTLRKTQRAHLHCFVEVASTQALPSYTLMQLSLNLCAWMQAWCDNKAFDTVIHPIPKCVIFLEDLLHEMVEKKSKDPFGTIRVARKALSKIRYQPQMTVVTTADIHALCTHKGTSKRCATSLWRAVQQGDPHQVSQQQSICSHNRS